MDSFSWIILGAGGARKVGAFCSLLNAFTPVLVYKGYRIISRPTMPSCAAVNKGGLEFLAGVGKSQSDFLSNQQLLEFQYCFSLSDANFRALLVNFSFLF